MNVIRAAGLNNSWEATAWEITVISFLFLITSLESIIALLGILRKRAESIISPNSAFD